MTAITWKIEVVDVVTNMAADVVSEEVVAIPHKSITMSTLRRTIV